MNDPIRGPCAECGEEKLHRPTAKMCLDCEATARIKKLTERYELPTEEEVRKRQETTEKRREYFRKLAKTPNRKAQYAKQNAKRGTFTRTEEEKRLRKERAAQIRRFRQMERAARKAEKVATKQPRRPKSEAVKADEAVQRELAMRELARRQLLRFILRNNSRYKAGWVHADICARLERFKEQVVAGEGPRLMLFMPPRHGKSMICSQEFPAWFLGHHPDREIISSSYSEPLTLDFSHKVQERVASPDFQVLFDGCKLKKGRESLQVWRTTQGGGYVAAGVGGPLTGRGADILIIDDPFKNRQDADSQINRDTVWNWFTSTAYTRLMPGGGVLIIQTRWHDDDLSGRLIYHYEQALKEVAATGNWPDDADKWDVVSYPAIATQDEKHRRKGEPLHPERYNLRSLSRIRRTIGPRDWAALYQQMPTPEEGEYFTKEMLRYYKSTPDHNYMTVFAAADLAISKKEHADYSVIMVAGVDANDDIWVLDVKRGRWDALEIIDNLMDVQRTWRPQQIGIEEGQITKSIGPFLDKRIREERLYSLNVVHLRISMRDKEMRARPIQGRMKQGKVYFAENAAWTQDLVTELLRFPSGVKDDQVDALAWLGQMMNDVQYRTPKAPKLKSWKDKLNSISASFSGGAMAA